MPALGAILLCCSVGTLVLIAVRWRLRTQLADQPQSDRPTLYGDQPRLPNDHERVSHNGKGSKA
jgi:hypothetical protein